MCRRESRGPGPGALRQDRLICSLHGARGRRGGRPGQRDSPAHALQGLGEHLRGHAVLVLQDQALLQRHRHGRAVLGALAAGEPDPVKAAADLQQGHRLCSEGDATEWEHASLVGHRLRMVNGGMWQGQLPRAGIPSTSAPQLHVRPEPAAETMSLPMGPPLSLCDCPHPSCDSTPPRPFLPGLDSPFFSGASLSVCSP